MLQYLRSKLQSYLNYTISLRQKLRYSSNLGKKTPLREKEKERDKGYKTLK